MREISRRVNSPSAHLIFGDGFRRSSASGRRRSPSTVSTTSFSLILFPEFFTCSAETTGINAPPSMAFKENPSIFIPANFCLFFTPESDKVSFINFNKAIDGRVEKPEERRAPPRHSLYPAGISRIAKSKKCGHVDELNEGQMPLPAI